MRPRGEGPEAVTQPRQQSSRHRIVGRGAAGRACPRPPPPPPRAPDSPRRPAPRPAGGGGAGGGPAGTRRVVLVGIPEPGLSLLRQLDDPVRECNRRQLAHLPPAELR